MVVTSRCCARELKLLHKFQCSDEVVTQLNIEAHLLYWAPWELRLHDEHPARQVDDDSFVRVAPLLDRVAAMPRAAAMLGYIESPGGGPHRDPDNQWHVSLDEWPTEKYPPWAHGAGACGSSAYSASGAPVIYAADKHIIVQ